MANKIILIKDTSLGGSDRTREFFSHFADALRLHGIAETQQLIRVADIGLYNHGMAVKIIPDNIIYQNVTDQDINRIIENSILSDIVLDDLVYKTTSKQVRIVLRNCGKIDPEDIHSYIRSGGYQGLENALANHTPDSVIQEIKTSGLRGRGGAGYPTW